jgi:hypothetical protein
LYWSPDDRFIATQIFFDEDTRLETARPQLIMIDRQTGDLTIFEHPLLYSISGIVAWTE